MPRILDFSDGFESASAPSTGSVTSNALKVFANDAAFVTDKGSAAVAGDTYFNSTMNAQRIFNGSIWFSNEGGDDVDVIGSISLDKADVASSATINALANSKSYIRITGATATALNGIVAPSSGIEKLLVINNVSSAVITIANQSGSASAADRIITPSGASVLIPANHSFVLIYDTTQTRWVFFSGISKVAQDTTPQLGGNLDVNSNFITSASNGNILISPNGTGRIRLSNSVSTTQYIDEKYFHATTLTASTAAVQSDLTFDTTVYKSEIVTYQIREATTNATRSGTLFISANGAAAVAGTTVSVVDVSGDTADVGVSWSGSIVGNDAQITYVTTANTKTMHSVVKRFLS